jgi:two-component system, NarL family, response regulator NreC
MTPGRAGIVPAEMVDRSTITIVLADDHEVVRDGVRMVLDGQADMEVVAEAADVDSASREVLGHSPTILVLDLNMPGRSSLAAIPKLVTGAPGTAIVVLTMQNEPAFAREALRAGALGFVLKHSAGSELVQAIRLAAEGQTYINPQLGARLAAEVSADGPPGGLSEREAEVLGLIALGHTNPEIAEMLGLSVRTIETHRGNIQSKLNLSTRAELVRYALDHDLLES